MGGLIQRGSHTVTRSHRELADESYTLVKRMARSAIRRKHWWNTYQATELAHDTLLRLGSSMRNWPSSRAFIKAAVVCMRHVLVDRTRRQTAQKRIPKRQQVPLTERQVAIFDRSFSEVEIMDVIERYCHEICPVRGQIILMRWQGYHRYEIMAALQLTPALYDRYFDSARKRICLWLLQSDKHRAV